MTYISPRVAIWGPFCPPLYTVYNNSRSRKELRTCVPGDRGFLAFSPSPPPLPPPPLPPVCLALSLAMSSTLFRNSGVSSFSRPVARVALAATLPLRRFSPASCVVYRESFRVRLRATDYRNQAIPGSGISTANYNHRFFSYVTSSFSCSLRIAAAAANGFPVAPACPPTAGKPVIR